MTIKNKGERKKKLKKIIEIINNHHYGEILSTFFIKDVSKIICSYLTVGSQGNLNWKRRKILCDTINNFQKSGGIIAANRAREKRKRDKQRKKESDDYKKETLKANEKREKKLIADFIHKKFNTKGFLYYELNYYGYLKGFSVKVDGIIYEMLPDKLIFTRRLL